jgi:hypothetical protein
MKYFLNDVQVEEDVYQKALKDHEEWVKEVEAKEAAEKKLDGRKSSPRKNPQKIK